MPRVGLSFIKPQFQKISVISERYFRRRIEVSYLCEIDVKKLRMTFKNITEYFTEIVEESKLKSYCIVNDDILYGIIELYINVRSF